MTVFDLLLWPTVIGLVLLIAVRPVVGRALLGLCGLGSRAPWDR